MLDDRQRPAELGLILSADRIAAGSRPIGVFVGAACNRAIQHVAPLDSALAALQDRLA